MEPSDAVRSLLAVERRRQPCPLVAYPDPAGRIPRGSNIDLEPWAIETAERIHQIAGDSVQLMVGALPYPPRDDWPTPRPIIGRPASELGLSFSWDTPTVASGHGIDHPLVITNASATPVTVFDPEAFVIDEAAVVVGAAAGPGEDDSWSYLLASHQQLTVSVTVGTASLDPRLGYAVPAGAWRCVIKLAVTNGEVWTNPLPLLIT